MEAVCYFVLLAAGNNCQRDPTCDPLRIPNMVLGPEGWRHEAGDDLLPPGRPSQSDFLRPLPPLSIKSIDGKRCGNRLFVDIWIGPADPAVTPAILVFGDTPAVTYSRGVGITIDFIVPATYGFAEYAPYPPHRRDFDDERDDDKESPAFFQVHRKPVPLNMLTKDTEFLVVLNDCFLPYDFSYDSLYALLLPGATDCIDLATAKARDRGAGCLPVQVRFSYWDPMSIPLGRCVHSDTRSDGLRRCTADGADLSVQQRVVAESAWLDCPDGIRGEE